LASGVHSQERTTWIFVSGLTPAGHAKSRYTLTKIETSYLQAVQPPRTALLGNTQGRPVGSHHERGRPRCGEHPLVATAIFFFGIGFSASSCRKKCNGKHEQPPDDDQCRDGTSDNAGLFPAGVFAHQLPRPATWPARQAKGYGILARRKPGPEPKPIF
jgi:hypothetical protein